MITRGGLYLRIRQKVKQYRIRSERGVPPAPDGQERMSPYRSEDGGGPKLIGRGLCDEKDGGELFGIGQIATSRA
jgi:hypothetical protein